MNEEEIFELVTLALQNLPKIVAAGQSAVTALQSVWAIFAAQAKAKATATAAPDYDTPKFEADVATVKAAIA